MRNILIIACSLLLLSAPCYADPDRMNSVKAAIPFPFLYSSVSFTLNYPSVMDYGHEIPRVEELPKPLVMKDFDVDLRLKSWADFRPTFENYWVTQSRRPPRVITKYRGLHGVIYRRAVRAVEKYLNNQLDILWENSLLHPMDLSRKQQEFNLARSSDSWWIGRDWMDYLPPEKGGKTTYFHTIGQDITILSLGSPFGSLEFHNTGKISLSGWDLAIRQGPTKLNAVSEVIDKQEIPPRERDRLNFAIATPEESFFSSDSWDLTGNIRVNVRPTWSVDSGEWGTNRTKIRGNLRLLIKGRGKQPWLAVDVEVSVRPFREEYAVLLTVALVNF